MNENTILTKELAEAVINFVIDEINQDIIIGYWNELTANGNLELNDDLYDLCDIIQGWFGFDGLVDALVRTDISELQGHYYNYDDCSGFSSYNSIRDFPEFEMSRFVDALEGMTIKEAIKEINSLSGRQDIDLDDLIEEFNELTEDEN